MTSRDGSSNLIQLRNAVMKEEKELEETLAERRLLSAGGTTGIGAGIASDEDFAAVPIIDLSLHADIVEEKLWEAANSVGFFTVINHGIPQDLIDEMFEKSKQFFDQPYSAKKEQSPFDRSLNCGYEFKEQIRPSCGLPDQKESIHICPRAGAMDERWPSTPGLRESAESMIPEAHTLALQILSLLGRRGCKHLKLGTLENAHSIWKEESRPCLRLLHYPAMSPDQWNELIRPGHIHWRAAPHTDFSCVTLLFQREGEEGLECRANPRSIVGEDEGTKWLPVKPVCGGIAVNIGDLLSHWSDGDLYANLHRVRMPRDEEECYKSRYSIAYFIQPDSSYVIEPKNNDPMTAGQFMEMRLKANFK